MKRKVFIVFTSIVIITILSAFEIYYTNGCPYHSGSPADGLNCGSCHHGGIITPTVNISSIPAFETGNKFIPGTTYTISITGFGYNFYGFDLEILNSQSTIANNVLDFGTISNITTSETLNSPTTGWTYSDITHSAPNSLPFKVLWQAPLNGTGYLYCALLGINNNGNTDGDNFCLNTMTLSPHVSDNISNLNNKINIENIILFPNPCDKTIYLNHHITKSENLHVELLNSLGIKIAELFNEEDVKTQNTIIHLPIGLLSNSYYLLISSGRETIIKKILVN